MSGAGRSCCGRAPQAQIDIVDQEPRRNPPEFSAFALFRGDLCAELDEVMTSFAGVASTSADSGCFRWAIPDSNR